LTNQLLSRSYGTVDKLQADQPMEMQLAVNALVIETEIEQEQEFTQVEIKLPTPYSKVKIESPVTELSMVEAILLKKLGLSPKVEKLQAGTK